MTISIDKKLDKAWDFLNKGKLEEALKIVSEIEEKDDLAPEDKLESLSLKGLIYFFLGKVVELLNITKYLSKESTRLNKPLYLVESIALKYGALALMTTDVSWESIEKAEQILKSVTQEPLSEIEVMKALILHMKGWMYYFEQEYDLALELLNKSNSIFEHHKHWAFMLDWQSWLIGVIYLDKGELDLALGYFKRFMEKTEGGILGIKRLFAGSLSLIGQIYYLKDDFDLAIEYAK